MGISDQPEGNICVKLKVVGSNGSSLDRGKKFFVVSGLVASQTIDTKGG
jgi:hypothetical protein